MERQGTARLADIGMFFQGEASGGNPGYLESDPFDQRFHLVDEVTGAPVADRRYRVTMNGRIYEGRTDIEGYTQRISASQAHVAQIDVFGEGA